MRSLGPAINDLALGRPVLITHGRGGEEAAEVELAGAIAEPSWTAWTIRHTSGFLCAAMRSSRADALNLPPMVAPGHQEPDTPVFGSGWTLWESGQVSAQSTAPTRPACCPTPRRDPMTCSGPDTWYRSERLNKA